jgi:hypothetical protein
MEDEERKATREKEALREARLYEQTKIDADRAFRIEEAEKQRGFLTTQEKERTKRTEAQIRAKIEREEKQKKKVEEREKLRRRDANRLRLTDSTFGVPGTEGFGDTEKNFGLGLRYHKLTGESAESKLNAKINAIASVTEDSKLMDEINNDPVRKKKFYGFVASAHQDIVNNLKGTKGLNAPIITSPVNINRTEAVFDTLRNSPTLKSIFERLDNGGYSLKKDDKAIGQKEDLAGNRVPVMPNRDPNNFENKAARVVSSLNGTLDFKTDPSATFTAMDTAGIRLDERSSGVQGNNYLVRAMQPTARAWKIIGAKNSNLPDNAESATIINEFTDLGAIDKKTGRIDVGKVIKLTDLSANRTWNAVPEGYQRNGKRFIHRTINSYGDSESKNSFKRTIREKREIQGSMNSALTNLGQLSLIIQETGSGGTLSDIIRKAPTQIRGVIKTLAHVIDPTAREREVSFSIPGVDTLMEASAKGAREFGAVDKDLRDRIDTALGALNNARKAQDLNAMKIAQGEVLKVALAYQLTAVLQGGTGGRTISDQDVKLAMGLFSGFGTTAEEAQAKIQVIRAFIEEQATGALLYSTIREEDSIGRFYAAQKVEYALSKRRKFTRMSDVVQHLENEFGKQSVRNTGKEPALSSLTTPGARTSAVIKEFPQLSGDVRTRQKIMGYMQRADRLVQDEKLTGVVPSSVSRQEIDGEQYLINNVHATKWARAIRKNPEIATNPRVANSARIKDNLENVTAFKLTGANAGNEVKIFYTIKDGQPAISTDQREVSRFTNEQSPITRARRAERFALPPGDAKNKLFGVVGP